MRGNVLGGSCLVRRRDNQYDEIRTDSGSRGIQRRCANRSGAGETARHRDTASRKDGLDPIGADVI
jgi:hypothetical protein